MQRLCSVLVALEGCDGVGDDGVGGEVLERGSQSSCCFNIGERASVMSDLRPGTVSNGPSRH